MSDDLSKLLGEAPTQIDAEDLSSIDPGKEAEPASPTVLKTDQWSRRRGEQITQDWIDRGWTDEWKADDGMPIEQEKPYLDLLAADAHSALFEPNPQFAERPEEKNRAEWWKQLLENPETAPLRNQTMLDTEIAALASKRIVDQWIEYFSNCEQPGEGGPAPGSDEESIESYVDRGRSVAEAVKGAREDVNLANELGAGLGMGEAGSPLDPKLLAQYFNQVKDDETLRLIFEWAGRSRRLCRSLQKQKTNATRGEITGIEQSGDIGRLVANERAQIAGVVPELELLAMKRLIDRRSLSYRHQKNEPKQSGPIVVCVDESGSMNGENIAKAKGIAMSMAWLARHQKRWIALVGFAGGEEGNVLAMPPNKKGDQELLDWLLHFYGGGTTLDVPIRELPFKYWSELTDQGMPRGKTDVIMITDAIVSAPDEMIRDYQHWAKVEQAKTYGIVIGGREPGDLDEVCDRCWCVDDIDLNSEAITEVLSI